jgi:hypothetical protein
MRMTPDHFAANAFDNILNREAAFITRKLRMIDGLEKEIAQLILEGSAIIAADCLSDFIGFLNRVRRYGRKVLLKVPWATRRGIAQGRHDSGERGKGSGIAAVDVMRHFCHLNTSFA